MDIAHGLKPLVGGNMPIPNKKNFKPNIGPQPSRSSSRFCGPRLPPLAWTIHTVRCSLIILKCSPLISLSFSQVKAFNQFSLQALANLNTLNSSSIRHTWPLLVHCEDRQSILLCGNLI
ncbi:hypothetical protein VP01_3123g1 [Puccinia sorghi]|uniref:Uncharacterized protein n=1 Tax=Puccinia sorghi TaxID=27349 RepID=A0A0L6V110_9BASI|nr:hypothetical protein VP01_3123g1 [Puccinia sorghi]